VVAPNLFINNFVDTLNRLFVQPAIIENVEKNLKDAVAALEGVKFKSQGTIAEMSFGDNATATSLSTHHGMAHGVMTDTLDGILKEIDSYTQNLQQSVELLRNTDEDSASAMQAEQHLVESLGYLQTHSQGDQANQDSRLGGANPYPQGDG
jgi:hypothetical protein